MEKKEAMKILKEFHDNSALFSIRTALDTVIPELKKSEDEKIRKEILSIVKSYREDCITEGNHRFDDCLTWLEKQGEQKETNLVEILKHYPRETELYSPLYGKLWLAEVDEKREIVTCYKHRLDEGCTRAILEQEDTVSFYSNGTTGLPDFSISKDCMLFLYDIEKQDEQNPVNKVEPKFRVGDWIINPKTGNVLQIKNILLCGNKGNYEFDNSSMSIGGVDGHYQQWTIKDAKDGDVLYCKKRNIDNSEIIMMYSGINARNHVDSYCRYGSEIGFNTYVTNVLDIEHDFIIPATKEQCDLLFQKMKEAGCEWDADKKELKNIEPKFKVGDWVVCNPELCFESPICIKDIDNNNYRVESVDGCSGVPTINYLDNYYHLWTIQDAKDGDVLSAHECIVLFKEINGLNIKCHCTYHFMNNPSFYVNTLQNKSAFHPATKEQRELLFSKMKEAGYEWDAEKKELKKIEQNLD